MKLDIRWGYNNIHIQKGDEWKATFKTNKGLFKPTVMFFGMCNSPATFQAMMDDIFTEMIDGKTGNNLHGTTSLFLLKLKKNHQNGTGKTSRT